MSIRMKSLRAHVYAGHRLSVGQEFDARGESDKRVLVAIKAAEVAPVSVPAPLPARESAAPAPRARARKAEAERTADFTAEPSGSDDPQDAALRESAAPAEPARSAPAKRTYRRRDLVAE